MKQIYSNSNIDVSNRDFTYPESGVSVPLECSKLKEIEFEEEF